MSYQLPAFSYTGANHVDIESHVYARGEAVPFDLFIQYRDAVEAEWQEAKELQEELDTASGENENLRGELDKLKTAVWAVAQDLLNLDGDNYSKESLLEISLELSKKLEELSQ